MKRKEASIQIDKLKGVLITRTAIKTLIPEDTVEKVIMFQFKQVKEMLSVHAQVEISGFGKFLLSPVKLKRKIDKMESILVNMEIKRRERPDEIPANRLAKWDDLIEELKGKIAHLKTKKGGYETKH